MSRMDSLCRMPVSWNIIIIIMIIIVIILQLVLQHVQDGQLMQDASLLKHHHHFHYDHHRHQPTAGSPTCPWWTAYAGHHLHDSHHHAASYSTCPGWTYSAGWQSPKTSRAWPLPSSSVNVLNPSIILRHACGGQLLWAGKSPTTSYHYRHHLHVIMQMVLRRAQVWQLPVQTSAVSQVSLRIFLAQWIHSLMTKMNCVTVAISIY